MELATEGPCAGHLCDNCATCRHGRCCKRDLGGYHLPDEGDWDGPIFGKIGVLNDDGGKLECHICGEWRRHLGCHLSKHDVTADEYRAIFGLSSRTGLANDAIRAYRRELATTTIHLGESGVNASTWTPEQRQAVHARTRPRSYEATHRPVNHELHVRAGRNSIASQRLRGIVLPQHQPKRVEVVCTVCSKAIQVKRSVYQKRTQRNGGYACSHECLRELRRILAITQHAPTKRTPEENKQIRRELSKHHYAEWHANASEEEIEAERARKRENTRQFRARKKAQEG